MLRRTAPERLRVTLSTFLLAAGLISGCVAVDADDEDDETCSARELDAGICDETSYGDRGARPGSDATSSADVGSSEAGGAELNAPETLSFPKVPIGGAKTRTLRITNEGTEPLTISNIEIEENGEDDRREVRIRADWEARRVVETDESDRLDVDIEYAPVDGLEDTATVRIESNDGVHEVALRFRSLDPRLQARETVRFPNIRPLPDNTCDRDTRIVTLENVGDSPLELKQIQFESNEGFWLTYPRPGRPSSGSGSSNGNNRPSENDGGKQRGRAECGHKHASDIRPGGSSNWPVDSQAARKAGLDGQLQPGETMPIRVWFEPETRKPAESELQIRWIDPQEPSNDQWFTIDLVANADGPCLRLEPRTTLDFGSITKGKTAPRPVTIENCRPRSSEPLKINGIEMLDDANDAFEIEPDSLPEPLRNGETLTIDGNESQTFTVVFKPPEVGHTFDGQLLVESNAPDRSGHDDEGRVLELVGKGSYIYCPQPVAEARVEGNQQWRTSIKTLPLRTIQLRSKNSNDPDGTVERYEWTILKRPPGSTQPLRPGPNDPNPTLKLDLAGTYKLELVVYDDNGLASCDERAIVTIEAIPGEDIFVQLVWDTPGDPDPTDKTGTDLDLHYVRPTDSPTPNWNSPTNDVFWANKTADWGVEGESEGEPSFNIDDTNGSGPEDVQHDDPHPDKNYKVGVHYYADRGLGPSFATVRIYLEQELKREFEDKFLPEAHTFWYVGEISWQNRVVYKRDIVQKGFPTQ